MFSGGVGIDLVYQGVMVSILTLTAFLIGHAMDPDVVTGSLNSNHGMTMAFLTMSMAEIFHSLNMRSQRNSIFALKKHNFWLYGVMVAAVILTALVIEVPFLANLFGFTVIDFKEYAIAMGLAVLVIPITEIIKLIQRLIARSRTN
jgi:Ca2+-transporting ATPase